MNISHRRRAAVVFALASSLACLAYACTSQDIRNDPGGQGLASAAGASGAGGMPPAAGGSAGAGGVQAAAGSAGGGSVGAASCAKDDRWCRGKCVPVGACEVRERLFADVQETMLEPLLPPKHRVGNGDGRASQMALVDYDGDGILDLVWATYSLILAVPQEGDSPDARFRVVLARGTGPCTFDMDHSVRLAEREYGQSVGFRGLWPIDIDRDGHLDLVTVAAADMRTAVPSRAVVSFFFPGDGTFRVAEADASSIEQNYLVEVGKPTDEGIAAVFPGIGTPQVVLLDAKGGLTKLLSPPLEKGTLHWLYDVDFDGRDDGIVGSSAADRGGGVFSLVDGSWVQMATTLTDPAPPSPFSRLPGQYRGDIDGDGHTDVGDGGNLYLLRGGGGFDRLPWPANLDGVRRLEDLDGDGLADGDRPDGKTVLGVGDGSFVDGPPALTVTGKTLPYATFADVDGDGGKEGLVVNGRFLWCYHHVGGVTLK